MPLWVKVQYDTFSAEIGPNKNYSSSWAIKYSFNSGMYPLLECIISVKGFHKNMSRLLWKTRYKYKFSHHFNRSHHHLYFEVYGFSFDNRGEKAVFDSLVKEKASEEGLIWYNRYRTIPSKLTILKMPSKGIDCSRCYAKRQPHYVQSLTYSTFIIFFTLIEFVKWYKTKLSVPFL